MSRFFLCQRVKVVACLDGDDFRPIGREGTINELNCYDTLDRMGWGVTIPGLAPLPEGGCVWDETGWVFLDGEIEPLTPPGMEPLADALALWLPEGETA